MKGRGFQLLEVAVVMALVAALLTAAAPPLLEWSSGVRLRAAAAEFVGVLRRTRLLAISSRTKVGVKFRTGDDGAVTFTIYRDGDGDGVRTADIADGTDPSIGLERRLIHVGADAGLGFPPDLVPRDPGDPRRRLERLDDPIRFNRSDIASFNPYGEATPGSLYLTDHRRGLLAVRLFPGNGRVRVLKYDPDREEWRLD